MQGSAYHGSPTLKDFFLSYSAEDLRWAEWIAVRLEDAGYSTILQTRDFRPGFDFIQEMHEASLVSRRTILLLSDGYLQELQTHPEWAVAFLKHLRGQKGALLPIRVQHCVPTGLLAPMVTLDLYEFQDEDLARQALLAGLQLQPPRLEKAPAFPGRAKSAAAREEDRNEIKDSLALMHSPKYPQKLSPLHKKVQVFLAYATEDEADAKEMAKYLNVLQRQGVVELWTKWQIRPGQERMKEFLSHLEQTAILLLLVSASLLSCDDITLFEEKVEVYEQRKRPVILPVLLHASDWTHSSFGHLAALPTNSQPISHWRNRDAAFVEVVSGIRTVIEQIMNV